MSRYDQICLGNRGSKVDCSLRPVFAETSMRNIPLFQRAERNNLKLSRPDMANGDGQSGSGFESGARKKKRISLGTPVCCGNPEVEATMRSLFVHYHVDLIHGRRRPASHTHRTPPPPLVLEDETNTLQTSQNITFLFLLNLYFILFKISIV